MSVLPIILPAGFISLYGYGSEISQTGVIPNNTKYKFASIYDVSPGGSVNVYLGQSVMFDETKVEYILDYNGWPYTIIDSNKISGVEIIPL